MFLCDGPDGDYFILHRLADVCPKLYRIAPPGSQVIKRERRRSLSFFPLIYPAFATGNWISLTVPGSF
jgi:hypothetical protein